MPEDDTKTSDIHRRGLQPSSGEGEAVNSFRHLSVLFTGHKHHCKGWTLATSIAAIMLDLYQTGG